MTLQEISSLSNTLPTLWLDWDATGLDLEKNFSLKKIGDEPTPGIHLIAMESERDIRRLVRELKRAKVEDCDIFPRVVPKEWAALKLTVSSIAFQLSSDRNLSQWEKEREGESLCTEEFLKIAEDNYRAIHEGKLSKREANLEVNRLMKRVTESEYILRNEYLKDIKEQLEKEYKATGESSSGNSKLLEKKAVVENYLSTRLKWNELKKQPELDGKAIDFDTLPILLAEETGTDYSESQARMIVLRIAEKSSYHPVRDYLNNCYESHKNNLISLDNIASTLLGTDNPLHSTYLRKHLIASIARIFEPGCKVDTALILKGNQGIGKSTFFSALYGKQYFNDTMTEGSDKDELLKLHSHWCIEWAELENIFGKKNISKVKAFMSTSVDAFRAPYGRNSKEYPRMCVLVGSTNKDEFLADPTGSRRFWIIPVNIPSIPIALVEKMRDEIWASAVAAYKAGMQWYLTEEEAKQSAEENKQYEAVDVWEEYISLYLSKKIREGTQYVTTAEILDEALNIEPAKQGRAEQNRVGDILKQLGWERKRVRTPTGREYQYHPPTVPTSVPTSKQVGTGSNTDRERIIESVPTVPTYSQDFSQKISKGTEEVLKVSEQGVGTHSPLASESVDVSGVEPVPTCLSLPTAKWNPGDRFRYIGSHKSYLKYRDMVLTVESYDPTRASIEAVETRDGFSGWMVERVL